MFAVLKRPHGVIDEVGHALVWRKLRPKFVEVTYPATQEVDHHGREWTLPQGNFRAAMTFTQWVRDERATLVVTYLTAQLTSEFREHHRLFMATLNSTPLEVGWGHRWFPAQPLRDAHLIDEGMAVLFSSVPEISRRFDRIEVHRGLNGDQRQVFTSGFPGIADKIEEFKAVKARRIRAQMEESRREREADGDVATPLHAVELHKEERKNDGTS